MNIDFKVRLLSILQYPDSHGNDELQIQSEVLSIGTTIEKVAIINWLARNEPYENRAMWNSDSFEILMKLYQRLNGVK